MKTLIWGVRFLIPFVVLYTIGYYVAGFSALTIPWLVLLSILIVIGEWAINTYVIGKMGTPWGKGIINFLVAAVILFLASYGIEGGHIPLGGALLAGAIIAVLTTIIIPERNREINVDERK